MDERKLVYINYETEQMENKLRAGKIYEEELLLLNILKERVDGKMSIVRGNITRDQNRRKNYMKPDVKMSRFKGIDVDKVKKFIMDNEFPEPEFEWSSVEDKIAEGFYEKYLR